MDDVTAALVRYTTGMRTAALSDRVRREVSRRLVDSVACAVGALGSDPVRALSRIAAARPVEGGCRVWGSSVRSTPEAAALTNATAVRLLDHSDYTVGGHPSDNIPAIVAACEWVDGTVADLVAGVLVSYEVFGELGRLMVRYRGWDQGTTAVIAAACGAGQVFGLDADQMASAVGMVATGNISTAKARRGRLTAWKGVAGPYAAASALLAVQMAAEGITAPHDAFAGEFGFFEQISGLFEVDGLDPVAEPRHLFLAAYKHWPVQFDLQPAVWLGLRVRDVVPIERIARVVVEASDWTWRGTARDPAAWTPETRETADHSLPFVLATALGRGSIGAADFAPARLDDPTTRSLMSRTSVASADDITASTIDVCWMRAVVTDVDGHEHAFEVKEARDKGLTDAELLAKWHQLVDGSGVEGADDLLVGLQGLYPDQRVRELFAPLSADI